MLDHGAQFFTVRSDTFGEFVRRAGEAGLAYEWCRGFNEVDGYPRYAVRGGMAALGSWLADGLDVRTATAVGAIRPQDGGGARFAVELVGGGSVTARSVLLTPPVPLSGALLAAGGIALDPALAAITYHRVLALLVCLDRPSGVAAPGGHQSEEGPFSFIGDNHQKGISEEVTVTFHTNHRLSAQHWDDPDDELTARLLGWAEPWLAGATPLAVELVRWAHSGPLQPWPEAVATVREGLLLAGDAFAGPKVEGAYLSGWAAGAALLELA
ncbi:MAG: FAD-dependent oxidoreductase [Acidimicrobiales bacterium]